MRVPLPVRLYDVVTVGDAPRTVHICRSADAQQSLTTALNRLRAEGQLHNDDEFACAPPRVDVIQQELVPGSRITSGSFEVAVEEVAAILIAATPQEGRP